MTMNRENNPRRILKRHGLHPKKQWGQNFLVDQTMVQRIVGLLDVQPTDRVVEFGAGTGILTQYLQEEARQIYAIERDRDLVAVLEEEFPQDSVQIIAADAARYDLKDIPGEGEGRLLVIGNLPYQISSPILFRLLEQREHWSRAVLMIQKEVADRLVAQHGDGKDYSALSIRFGAFFHVEQALFVSRNCFFPRPRVESAVVTIDRLPTPLISDEAEPWFTRAVKCAYASRRKTLFNNLKAAFPHVDKQHFHDMLATLQLDPQCRGETLSIDQFADLGEQIRRLLEAHPMPAPPPAPPKKKKTKRKSEQMFENNDEH